MGARKGGAEKRQESPGYQLFMLVLCVYALVALTLEVAVELDPEVRRILEYADNVLCAVFFVDFLHSLAHARNRKRYLLTWGWIDLLSSIPVLEFARWGRAARVLRILRVLRGMRATKLLVTMVLRRRTENVFLALTLATLILLVFSSVAILEFEKAPDSNIKTGGDALWWAVATITTVGYGDHYPVTTEGRITAMILMFSGVGLFGALSGILAAWLLATGEEEQEAELEKIRKELTAVRQALERLTQAQASDAPGAHPPSASARRK